MHQTTLRHISIIGLSIGLLAAPVLSRDTRHGALRLTGAWSRPIPRGAAAGIGYVTITNTGGTPDRLIGGISPSVARVEVHEMSFAGGIMRMRPLSDGIPIAPGKTVRLGPGGYHVMLIGPKKALAAGQTIPVTLRFQRAGEVRVLFDVKDGSSGYDDGDFK
ncbi:copper chaperone PCu(A)C [Sphingomonas sp. PvP056]|uniref:copper chaperone PCu(A)C n=1 Tax=Sphingomonas sp. PvP056 TaxID=3156392 RepID=UPI0033992CEF